MGKTGTGATKAEKEKIKIPPKITSSKWVWISKDGKEIKADKVAFKSTVKLILTGINLDDVEEVSVTILDDADKAELDVVKTKVSGNTAASKKIELKEEWAGKVIKIKVKKDPFEEEFIGAKLKIVHGCKCTVYFRPLDTPPGSPPKYNGEFGFDWLRDGKPDNTKLEYKAYKETIVAGYKDGLTDLSKNEAYSNFKSEYTKIDTNEHLEKKVIYRVPYLDLYPKAYSEAVDVTPAPPFEAKLKLWVRIEHDDVDEIRLEINDADKTFLNINNSADPFLLSKKDRNTKVEESDEITITCLGELAEDKKIIAYAYPRGCLAKPEEEQLKERIVAGQLLVCKNDDIKDINFVFVRVQTKVSGRIPIIGEFDKPGEKDWLRNVLYQALICPSILTEEKYFLGLRTREIVLDLSKDAEFKTGGEFTRFRLRNGTIVTRPELNFGNTDMLIAVKNKFHRTTKNRYAKHFTIFTFNANLSGRVEYIGKKNVVIGNRRWPETIAHEAMHGFGLWHTHREKDIEPVIENPNKKYVFPHPNPPAGYPSHPDNIPDKGTDNIMSYNGGKRNSTWHWQWKIARQKI